MCIKLLLSFYHIACNSDVINGSVRYFFWAIGVMKKLLRAQWTEKLCQFSREKREIRALWEQHRRRVTAIREQRWQSVGPLSCNGLHCSLAGFQVGWYKYLSKPIKDQLVFIRLNEAQLLAQESKQWVIELPQKVMFSAYLNTTLISDRDLCKYLTNNKCHFLFVVFSH